MGDVTCSPVSMSGLTDGLLKFGASFSLLEILSIENIIRVVTSSSPPPPPFSSFK